MIVKIEGDEEILKRMMVKIEGNKEIMMIIKLIKIYKFKKI